MANPVTDDGTDFDPATDWAPGVPKDDGPRYWINDSLDPSHGMPYGHDTWGIVDEAAGGTILYVSRFHARRICDLLNA